MKLLEGKKGVILGVLNNKSIAWGIAKEFANNGAEFALTYLGEAGEKRVKPLAKEIGCKLTVNCDVSSDSDLDKLFSLLEKEYGKLDFLVHAVAFSDKNELKGKFYNTTRENFKLTMDVSCYSLIALSKRALPLMEKSGGGNILALTYYGSEKVIPNYNIMGVAKSALESSIRYLAADLGEKNIRVNGISSGPIKTLAAAGINGFNYMLKYNEINSPLRKNITPEDNGRVALFLASELSSGITGEIVHLDSGFNIMGMKDPYSKNLEVPEGATIE